MAEGIDEHQQAGIYLTILSFSSSVAAFIISAVTKTNVAWLIGIIAGLLSIYCGYLTQKEKRMNIRRLEDDWSATLKKRSQSQSIK